MRDFEWGGGGLFSSVKLEGSSKLSTASTGFPFPLNRSLVIENIYRADHDDQEVVLFNRSMLPAYYGILRMCCQASRSFTRQLAMHQNIQWAFKNITPYPGQYTVVSGFPQRFKKSI